MTAWMRVAGDDVIYNQRVIHSNYEHQPTSFCTAFFLFAFL